MTDSSSARRQQVSLFGLLGTLYLVQGLPFGFVTQALPVVLRQEGVELSKVTLASAVALPWALKFLWAPWVDAARPPWWGRRFGIIIPMIWCASLAMALLGSLGVRELAWFMAIAVALNFFAATQDIATDGLAVERLTPRLRGLGNAVQIIGYRVGMFIGGGLILVLMDYWGSKPAIWSTSGILLTCSLIALIYALRENHGEAPSAPRPEASSRGALGRALRSPSTLAWLAAIGIYKLGDALAQGVLKPFLVDGGLGLAEIGQLVGTWGFSASILGALIGGWLARYLPRSTALLVFGILQAASIWPYVALDGQTLSMSSGYLWTACIFEHFAGSLSSVILFTIMMDRCRPAHTGDDYTLQTCAQLLIGGSAQMLSGSFAQHLGYADFFATATFISLVGVVVAWWVYRWGEPEFAAAQMRGDEDG